MLKAFCNMSFVGSAPQTVDNMMGRRLLDTVPQIMDNMMCRKLFDTVTQIVDNMMGGRMLCPVLRTVDNMDYKSSLLPKRVLLNRLQKTLVPLKCLSAIPNAILELI